MVRIIALLVVCLSVAAGFMVAPLPQAHLMTASSSPLGAITMKKSYLERLKGPSKGEMGRKAAQEKREAKAAAEAAAEAAAAAKAAAEAAAEEAAEAAAEAPAEE